MLCTPHNETHRRNTMAQSIATKKTAISEAVDNLLAAEGKLSGLIRAEFGKAAICRWLDDSDSAIEEVKAGDDEKKDIMLQSLRAAKGRVMKACQREAKRRGSNKSPRKPKGADKYEWMEKAAPRGRQAQQPVAEGNNEAATPASESPSASSGKWTGLRAANAVAQEARSRAKKFQALADFA